ncbi:MAG: sulfite exporter TauE/SafE family protein [Desulfovermiculus sp.]|nr:sulfite exporter TauE/SafE family protein [Desulfovermiculus sp.]
MEIQTMHIIVLLITGVGVGFAAGLLGVGGCFIMVPVQFWVLKSMGVDPTIAIRIAFGTNLLVVLPTALSGALTHHTKGAVLWKQGVILGVIAAFGAFLGGFFASNISAAVLTKLFGVAIIVGAIRMLTAKPPKVDEQPSENILAYVFWGIILGIVSGLIGIGGGVLMIPVMVVILKFRMHQAVGTSTALMMFAAIGGVLAYMLNGLGVQGLPPYSTGYVNWLQWILLAGCSIPMAFVGARSAHLIPAKQLKYLFIIVMFYMGLKMCGVFAWLGLPI